MYIISFWLYLSGADANVCPSGYYCPVGTASPLACPIGTYSNVNGLAAETDCTLCDAGSFCQDPHITATTGLCSRG